MDSRYIRTLLPSLSSGDLENRAAELRKLLKAPVPAPSEMSRWIQAKCIDPVLDIPSVTALTIIRLSNHFMFTSVANLYFSELETPYFWQF